MNVNYGSNFTTEESVESKGTNLKFGLNQKVFLKEIKYEPNAGQSGAEGEAFDFIFNVAGTETKARIYPVTSVTVKGVTITDPEHEEFKKSVSKLQAWCTSFFKCFITEEQLKSAIATAAQSNNGLSFAQYMKAQMNACGKEALTKTPLDLFLEYGTVKDEGKKYLQVPKSRINGKFVSKHVPGDFKELKNNEGLKYVNSNGEFHPFSRSSWWLENVDSAKPGATASAVPSGIVHSAPQNVIGNPFATTPSAPATTGTGDFEW